LTHKGAVDAVVVGSGAGGGPVALTLARAGYKVVVLEKGSAYDQRDFVNDEIRFCRRDFFVPYTSDEPHVRVGQGGRSWRTNEGWTACCVGGATVHMAGFTYRLHPEDLRLRSLLGEVSGADLADWPISWEELLPYYERAEIELGVSGEARQNPFETFRRPLPLPPLPSNGIAKLMEQACRTLGYHPFQTARAILSRAWQGRARCQLSFFCASYGCETGAKSSVLAAILPKALATGNCQVRPLSMVHTVEVDSGGRATGVRYFDRQGNEKRLGAAVVVLACSPIETARLLLKSRSKPHRDGLANASGQVGRNLMFTGLATGTAEFDRADPRMKSIDWRQPFVDRSFQDFYVIDRETSSRRKGGTVSFLFPHANPIFTAERLATEGGRLVWGKALKDALRHVTREVRELEFEVFSETLPTPESRVTLDPTVKDRWGQPVARFETRPHPVDGEVNRVLVGKGLEVLGAMGGKHAKATRVAEQTYWLQAGTCRFGDDPQRSVLNRDCRAHDVPNLFVTDGSFLPTSGGVPTTLTVEANALRVGDRIVALGRAHGLFRSRPGAAGQSPGSLIGGERGLDHVGVAVRDLDGAAKVYQHALGFGNPQPGRLPNGLQNVNFYFGNNTYLELLTVYDRAKNRWVASFIDSFEKGAMFLVLSVASAAEATAFLKKRGHPVGKPAPGRIEGGGLGRGKKPMWHTLYFDKSPLPGYSGIVYFIAYDRELRDFVREKTKSEKIRRRSFSHPNTALGMRSTWMAVKDLKAARQAYESIGLPAVRDFEMDRLGARGVEITAGDGAILLLEAKAPDSRVTPFIRRRKGEGIIGVSIEVEDLATARALIQRGTKQKLPTYDGLYGQSILVPAEIAYDVWLELFQR
jgi:choline dehydrogenase-like flavoprotein/catechol 2,3-dioxygenase-like lactoylglutathione lyase family enzyme